MRVQAGVGLAPFTTLGIGGEARWFVRVTTVKEMAAADAWCRERSLSLFVLGGGSNLVVSDGGYDGLVMQVAIRGIAFSARDGQTVIRAGAGEPWDDVVAAAVSRGLAGLECLSGIPGSVGGTPIQNVGAYGQDVAASITEVTVFDRDSASVTVLSGADCGFGYRTSRFKRHAGGRQVVCGVTFRLQPGPPTVTYPDVITYLERAGVSSPTLSDVRQAVLAIRRRKGMVIDPSDQDTQSVGSFFRNPIVGDDLHTRLESSSSGPVPAYPVGGGQVKIPAAWLIEHAGFRCGYGSGRAGLSSKHPLAIINRGGATARDVLDLAVRIKRRVAERFGIRLRPEPVFVGFAKDDADVLYLERETG